MRRTLVATALIAVAGVAVPAVPASASPIPAPPYVSRAQWTHRGGQSSLHVYPTRAGRDASVTPNSDAAGVEAWSEVLTLKPDAATPGMYAQFMCHWHFAEFAEPGKVSWNLEPWRPVVSDEAMATAGCNPGGPEESY